MARVSHANEKRRELLPVVAAAFAELGYRRTTTAELAQRCGVRENILYRLWTDKKAMFIAALGYVYDESVATWGRLLAGPAAERSPAERLLEYEAEHHGELGHYRLVFAGLSETDDPEIRAALADLYARFQQFVAEQIAAYRVATGRAGRSRETIHRKARSPRQGAGVAPLHAAWGVVGLGTVANIARELGLVSAAQRQALYASVGRLLLEGGQPGEHGRGRRA